MKHIPPVLIAVCFLALVGLAGCQTGAGPGSTAPAKGRGLAPERVDVRGTILVSRYSEGQVVLEVEGFPTAQTRYNRAFVLVTPITQIVDQDGQAISLSELRQGQHVAIVLRGGGRGNLLGVGEARKVWLEELR